MTTRNRTDLIVIHCSATRGNQPVDARDIRRWHKARGWKDIGYHFVITRNGTVQEGRHIETVGSHVAGFNSRSLGICLVGGLDNVTGRPVDNFTQGQKASLKSLVEMLARRYVDARICGHRDLSPDKDGDGKVERHEWLKDCPCFDVRQWAAQNGFKPL